MNRARRRAAAVLLAGAVAVGVAGLSRVPYSQPRTDRAVVRLSWRVAGERVEECRRLSQEELAAQPIHMRRTEVCEGKVLPYRLLVEVDGRVVVRETVRPSGAREDRPLYVYREVPMEPGPHRLRVRFVREVRDSEAHEDEERHDDAGDNARGRGIATPARLELRRSIDARSGDVVLVTYDPELRRLVTRVRDP